MSLSVQYFEKVHIENKEGVCYESYRPRDKPMVLFSLVDGSPLAALTLRCQTTSTQIDSEGTRGKALITARPDTSADDLQRFQGLIDRDGQEFELVITNLSSTGYINFNILKSDEKVTEVNPHGLNEINELRPYESYAVKCSQENNLSLILSTIKDEATGSSVTIKQDEDHAKKTGEKTKGTYYFLSVVPQTEDTVLCKNFEKTIWKCVDLLMIQRKVPVQSPWEGRGYTDMLQGANVGGFGRVRRQAPRAYNSTLQSVGGFDGFCGLERSENALFRSAPLGINTVGTSLRNASHNVQGGSFSKALNRFKGEEGEKGEEELEEEDDDEMGFGLFEDESTPSFKSATDSVGKEVSMREKSKKSSLATSSLAQKDDVIMGSQAASIKYGREIQVTSATTGIDYDYDKTAARCVIGLSVSNKLEFYPEPDIQALIADSKELIKEYLEQKYVSVLEKVYDMEDCCICLEEEPDTVFYQCGHKCIHLACINTDLNKCPACRTRISAYLKLATDVPDDVSDTVSDIEKDIDELADALKTKVVMVDA